MDHRLLGLLLIVTGLADFLFARRLQQLSYAARLMLYVFGGAFAALGLSMILGGQRTP